MQRNIPVIKQSSVLWLKDFQVVNKCPNGLYVNWLIMWLMVSSLELKLSLMSVTWFLLWLWAWDEKTAVGYTKALVTMLGRSPAAQPGTRSLLRLPIPKVIQGYWSGIIRSFGIRLYSCTCQEELWVCFSLEFCSFISLFAALALCTSTGVASPACCFFMGHLLFSKGSVHPFLVICSYM